MREGKTAANLICRVLCLLGCAWFLLPVLHRGFALGAAFGFCVCLGGFLLLTFYGRLARRGGWRKAAVRLLACCYGIGLAWAAVLTGMMLSVNAGPPPAGATVIVLGSQVYSAERMGVSLTNRIDAAAAYLAENPESRVIVTGGQGADEPCPEALTQRNALLSRGIGEDRIYLEDQSANTRENLAFALEIAGENGLGENFVLATQRFHQYRALKLAELADAPRGGGDRFTPLTAETDWILLPEYYGRELLSLTKFHAQLAAGVFAPEQEGGAG